MNQVLQEKLSFAIAYPVLFVCTQLFLFLSGFAIDGVMMNDVTMATSVESNRRYTPYGKVLGDFFV